MNAVGTPAARLFTPGNGVYAIFARVGFHRTERAVASAWRVIFDTRSDRAAWPTETRSPRGCERVRLAVN